MSEITRVALDAMGGDNAPQAMVQGAVDVARKRKDIIRRNASKWCMHPK